MAVGSNITATYTTDGSTALTELSLGDSEGDGFALYVASTRERVSATVTISANVVTVNPDSNLAAGTIYELKVADGAVRQTVDANGNASSTGIARPIQGEIVTFKTA